MVTKAIIFDLWNTIVYNKGKTNPMVTLEKMLGLNMKLYREVELGFMTKRFETKKEAMISLCKHIGVKPKETLVNSLIYVWDNTEINITFFPEVIRMLQKLKEKYKLALLSNTDCFSTKKFIDSGYGKYFDFMAFSCNLGILKPDPEIFKIILEKLGVKPEETVMVGDNLKDDVLAAEKLGIKGILMKRDFEKFGAKPSWIESGTHERTIKDLTELERFL